MCVPFTMLCARYLTRQVLTTAQMLRASKPPKLRHFESANSKHHCTPVPRKSTPRAATKREFTGMAYCYDMFSPLHRYHAWKPQKLRHHRGAKFQNSERACSTKVLAASRQLARIHGHGLRLCFRISFAQLRCLKTSEI